MKYLIQMSIIFIILVTGNIISSLLKNIISIPGAIIGMILLFFLLLVGVIKEEDIKETCDFFLNNLAFFFIPSGVGIIISFTLIKSNLLFISTLLFLTTIISIIITSLITEIMIKEKE